MKTTSEVKCPICRLLFHVDEYLEVGDSITCPTCSTDLEIIHGNPLRVREATSEEYSYGYEYDEDEEEQ